MFGFIRVGCAVPLVSISNTEYNAKKIIALIEQAKAKGIEVLCFPELCITGYNCADLFRNSFLLDSALNGLRTIAAACKGIVAIVGLPIRNERLYSCSAVISNGKVTALIPKTKPSTPIESRIFCFSDFPADYDFFGEKIPFGNYIFKLDKLNFAVDPGELFSAPFSGAEISARNGANLVIMPDSGSTTAFSTEKKKRHTILFTEKTKCAAVICGSGILESSCEMSCSGQSLIAENGALICENECFVYDEQLIFADIDSDALAIQRDGFENGCKLDTITLQASQIIRSKDKLERYIARAPFLNDAKRNGDYEEIFEIMTAGLYKKMMQTGIRKTVLGVSGGLDSSLAFLALVYLYDKAGFKRSDIISITMPGFGTSGRTYNNSLKLMREMNVSAKVISIKESCIQHFKDIGLEAGVKTVAYENSQARERTQILMDIANMENGLVIGTGDMSESALGFCTYNGDQMSMYCLNGGIPKTMIRPIIKWASENLFPEIKDILNDVITTEISPELLPTDENNEIAQKTEEIVGPYELIDFFLYHFIKNRFSPAKIAYIAKQAFSGIYEDVVIDGWLKKFCSRFFISQFKRQAIPDSPQVFGFSLSPRTGFSMSCDADFSSWINKL